MTLWEGWRCQHRQGRGGVSLWRVFGMYTDPRDCSLRTASLGEREATFWAPQLSFSSFWESMSFSITMQKGFLDLLFFPECKQRV